MSRIKKHRYSHDYMMSLYREEERLIRFFCEENNISCPKYYSELDILNNQFTFPIIKKPIIKQLPMEYALELNRLLELEMTGSVG